MELPVRRLTDELRLAATGVTLATAVLFAVVLALEDLHDGALVAGSAGGIVVLLAGLSTFDRRYDDPRPWPEGRKLAPVPPVAIRDAAQIILALVVLILLESSWRTDGTGVILPLVMIGRAAASWRTWFRTRASERRLHCTLYREVASTPRWIRTHGNVYAVANGHPAPIATRRPVSD